MEVEAPGAMSRRVFSFDVSGMDRAIASNLRD
jgi:hypothetical protein